MAKSAIKLTRLITDGVNMERENITSINIYDAFWKHSIKHTFQLIQDHLTLKIPRQFYFKPLWNNQEDFK